MLRWPFVRQMRCLLLAAGLLQACGSGGSSTYVPPAPPQPVDLPASTGSNKAATALKCDSGTTLTYENFGEGFFLTYCSNCHSAKVSGAARYGAPVTSVFDTVGQIQNDLYAIQAQTIAGTSMPPGRSLAAADKSAAQTWLGCGAPTAHDLSRL